MSATMEDALTEALLWLKDEPPDNELAEVHFGRYSDRTGFWWTLRFSRDITSGQIRESRQDDEKRISMIVGEWSTVCAEIRNTPEVPA